MPGWQQFYAQHRSETFELVAVALEHTGAEAARPFVEAAGAGFPVVVDEHGHTSVTFGFRVVPNGVLVDAEGIVRWAKYGGFSVERADDRAAVERFAQGLDPGPALDLRAPYTLGPVERDLVETKVRLGHLLFELGRHEDAVEEWRGALRYDPENLVIRKQIWAALYPERFFPRIDWDWQREQLRREREAEIAAGICGPDGCPLPRTTEEERR